MQKFFRSSLVLILLLALTFSVRLYRFSNPLADWHSWRQVDTSAVSRSFIQNGFDLLHPTFHDLSNIPSGLDNPQGYRFVEFPIYNVFQAGGYLLFPVFTLEEWGRLITIISSTLTTLFLYLIVKRHSDAVTASFVAFFYAVLPYGIYYGRVVLPDPSMVMAIMGGIYFFDRALDKKFSLTVTNYEWFMAALFTAAAFLLKPYALFFTLPMVVLAFQKFGLRLFLKWEVWLFVIITVTPLFWWRWWMLQYPEGIPSNDWLFNGGNIRFKPSYFFWIFGYRLNRLLLGYWGIAIVLTGLLAVSKKEILKKSGIFFYSFLISSLLYVTIIARGNVQHDYYQILIVPSIVIFLGIGAKFLFFPPREQVSVFISRTVLFVCVLFTLGLGWYTVRDYFNINNPAIIIAGEAMDKLTPKDAKIIAPLDGDTTFLYYTQRKGWPSFQQSLPEMVQKGATHLVLLNPQEKDLAIGKQYKIMAYTKEYLLFNLREKP